MSTDTETELDLELQQLAERAAELARDVYNLAAQILDECATFLQPLDETAAETAATPEYYQEWGCN